MFTEFIVERFLKNKDKTAILWQGKKYDYHWLLKEIANASELLNKNKIKSGSTVVLQTDFTPKSIAFFLALIENANIIIPLNNTVKNPDEIFKISEAEFVIKVNDEVPEIIWKNNQLKHEIFQGLMELEHPGLVLFSSGSTGKSKASVHDFVFLLNKFKTKRQAFRTITFLLFDHIGGINTLFYVLSNTGMIVCPDSRDPESICKIIEKYQVELLPTSPTFLNMLLISEVYKKYNLESLQIVTYGTEAMPEYTLKKFHDLFPKVQLKQTYGLSELGIMRSKSKSSNSLWMKVGGEDYQTKIKDGVLYIKAKTAMLGYLNAPSPFDDDGWFNTQDRVEKDGEWIKILGRETDIINVGGQKVYPAEIESVLLELDNIVEVSAYGVSNPIMGNVVAARINLNQNEELFSLKKRIRNFCKNRLESFKIPAVIKITDKKQISNRFKKIR